ncbi:lipid-A-disaccharide synthase [Pseudobacteriovorax antillogorgiicola]|uniref:Lipid-A-disaccharide synthase n=1 Tax=Pseudobacteriovorax antillogorgiicola TaxID=1513793 RepID=A0A1Y6CNF5_9BACT|nr:lipid-A-disaccharide synthase [Pseudobacteriovorax antillogorgiicola]TCS45009.1 lipid-A-disaccharide synthase [Pseudobacteriovorax antillogorgiicola]SMF76412.1 lipid-A-disaccharide synthase [Pseudobacteriovorax antillogorgiicola]
MASFFLSVGEPSGDVLGAELVAALNDIMPHAHGFGIAGPKLRNLEYEEIAGIEELSVMGFVEVIKHITYLKRLEDRLLMEIDRRQPDFAVLVDYPGFNMRFAEFLKVRKIPVIQFVAPQLWAWKEGRTKKLRDVTDLVMGIMPFEETFFNDRDVNFKYVGTPQVDRAAAAKHRPADFKLSKPTIGFFPGSRRSELSKMLPMALAIRDEVRSQWPDKFQFAISMAPSLDVSLFNQALSADESSDLLSELSLGQSALLGDTSFVRGESLDLMASVNSALVTSGTATLECALTNCPLCVVYRMSPLSYQLAKRLVKLPHISLVNLVAGREIIREFVQEFTYEEVAQELAALASDGDRRETVLGDLTHLHTLVQGDLSRCAALAVQSFMNSRQSNI